MSSLNFLRYAASGPDFDDYTQRLASRIADELARNPSKLKAMRASHGGRVNMPIIRPPQDCERNAYKRFEYKPLLISGSIRLLQLLPLDNINNEFDKFRPIQCRVVVRNLNEMPVYDALSYT
ncbi:hypothetical protein GQ53DRAFT_744945 [Thozetella sp. PMI_491]|nr:hypothetical protein GQ53DRAFT_744945 [Thozetella sp. PMI_491]